MKVRSVQQHQKIEGKNTHQSSPTIHHIHKHIEFVQNSEWGLKDQFKILNDFYGT